MTNSALLPMPLPAYAGGTQAITLTPVVGTPRRQYAEMFVPGTRHFVAAIEEALAWDTAAGCGPINPD